jgi:hypothetical protein
MEEGGASDWERLGVTLCGSSSSLSLSSSSSLSFSACASAASNKKSYSASLNLGFAKSGPVKSFLWQLLQKFAILKLVSLHLLHFTGISQYWTFCLSIPATLSSASHAK